jgi:hypothetical protein
MQAIRTKYAGPTNHRGTRVIAESQAGRVVVPWDYAADPVKNHRIAAFALMLKLNWTGRVEGGQLPDGSYAWVFVP